MCEFMGLIKGSYEAKVAKINFEKFKFNFRYLNLDCIFEGRI